MPLEPQASLANFLKNPIKARAGKKNAPKKNPEPEISRSDVDLQENQIETNTQKNFD